MRCNFEEISLYKDLQLCMCFNIITNVFVIVKDKILALSIAVLKCFSKIFRTITVEYKLNNFIIQKNINNKNIKSIKLISNKIEKNM